MPRASLQLAFAACVLTAAAAPLAGQGFNGVIQFANYRNPEHPDTLTQMTKGQMLRLEGFGRGGGALIVNGDKRIVLMSEQKAYMEMPANMGDRAREMEKKGTATNTGKTETVAGISCDVWHFTGKKSDGTPQQGDACIAKNAGLQIGRLSGGMMGRAFSVGGAELGDALKNGGGVMKVTEDGKTTLVAVNVKETSVPDAMFSPPADYTAMGGMGKP